jgi:hypothetical protein
VIAVLTACALAFGLSAHHASLAQPAPPSQADLDRARDLYKSAETAMLEFRWSDAIRDYLLAFELTKDPALLYKIAVANEKAGRCQIAVVYYRRYLKDGKPTGEFLTLTRDKIRACHEDPDLADSGSGSGSGSGSAAVGSAAGSGSSSGSAVAVTDAGSGSAAPPPKLLAKPKHRAAWLLIGGALAAVTTGAVLAYQANASERDVDDLYVGLGGITPTFDASTRKKFDDLIAEGKRYEHLSWVSFGVAGVVGGIAAWRFATDKETSVTVTPTVSPTGAGACGVIRW